MKKIISLILSVLMICTGILFGTVSAFAENDSISCLAYENGSFVSTSFSGERLVSNSTIFGRVHIAAAGKTVFNDRVEFSGIHTIILCDGADLVFENGIQLEYGSSLSIYSQSHSSAMGRMTVYGYGGNAAIGGNKGQDYAINPLDRDGRPGGSVYIHGGNIDVYSESVGFGGGDGGIGCDSPEGINAGDAANGGVGGLGLGGAIYGGNVVLHSGRSLFGGGNGGNGGNCRSASASGTFIAGQDYSKLYSGNGGDGGDVAHVLLYGGRVQISSYASFVRGGDGGNGGSGIKYVITDSIVTNNNQLIDVNGTEFTDSGVLGAFGGNGGNGGDVRDLQFLDGTFDVNGGDICICGGNGGDGGRGADIDLNCEVRLMALIPGNGGSGGDGGIVKMFVKGGDATVGYGKKFISGGNGGNGSDHGIAESHFQGFDNIGGSLKNGKNGNNASCELNFHAGKMTINSAFGRLMGSGKINYFDYMSARIGETLESLGPAGQYNDGLFKSNSCAVIESTSDISVQLDHNGNNYWLNEDYSSMYFLSDDVKGDVTVDLNGHTWTITGEKTFGKGINMLEIKNGTLIFTNPNMDAFIIENGLRLNNVTFKNCTCGRLFYITEEKTTQSDFTEFVVKDCTFTNCSFTKDGGAFFFACKKSSPRWYYLFENDIFNDLKTTEDGSVMYIDAFDGGMYNGRDWPSLDLVGCTFNKCHADGNGGAIYAFENIRIGNFLDECGNLDRSPNNVRSNLFINCSAGENGGALLNAGWDASTIYCTFISCTSKTGAVYAGQQPVHFSRCDFFGNDIDIYHDDSYGYGMEEKDMIYDMSQFSNLVGEGTELNPYILQNAYDIAFLAEKCEKEKMEYSCAVYTLACDITDVFTPVSGFDGILITNGNTISTRFTGDAFTGNYGLDGTLTVENLLGKVIRERAKSNFRHMESSHPYGRFFNEVRTYYRPGASSITLTFSKETSVYNMGDDWIIVYDGNGNEIYKYNSPELAEKTITVSGDTVQVRLLSGGYFLTSGDYPDDACYGFKVSDLTATYSTTLASMISGGSLWIILIIILGAVAGASGLLIVNKKKKSVPTTSVEKQ